MQCGEFKMNHSEFLVQIEKITKGIPENMLEVAVNRIESLLLIMNSTSDINIYCTNENGVKYHDPKTKDLQEANYLLGQHTENLLLIYARFVEFLIFNDSIIFIDKLLIKEIITPKISEELRKVNLSFTTTNTTTKH